MIAWRVKGGGNHCLVKLSYWLWSGIFHEIDIINTTFTQTLREEGKKTKKEMCMWSGRNKAWNVSCHLASHGYPSPNTSENMKPQCHNENSFVYIIIEHNQHLEGEKRKKSKYTAPILINCQLAQSISTLCFYIWFGSEDKRKRWIQGKGALNKNKKHQNKTVLSLHPALIYFKKKKKDLMPQAKY